MFKKITCICVMLSLLLTLAACGTSDQPSEYPVTISHFTVEQEPQKVIVLSDNAADIISALGYQSKLTARSDQCTQKGFDALPSVGPKNNPKTEDVINMGPDVIFADETLDTQALKAFEEAGITVLRFVTAKTRESLEIMYQNIGKVLGGNITGAKTGKDTAQSLFTALDDNARKIPDSNIIYTACYLYDLKGSAITGDMFANELFTDSGAVNIGSDLSGGYIDFEVLKNQNPQYIFCAEGVKALIAKDANYSKLTAVKKGRVVEIPAALIARQGQSATDAVKLMTGAIYPALAEGTQTDAKSLAAQYGIKIEKVMVLQLEDGADNAQDDQDGKRDAILAVQKRLDDLNYWPLDEITGYFGETTAAVVKEFKASNGIDATDGIADEKTLTILFSKGAVERATPARDKTAQATQPATGT